MPRLGLMIRALTGMCAGGGDPRWGLGVRRGCQEEPKESPAAVAPGQLVVGRAGLVVVAERVGAAVARRRTGDAPAGGREVVADLDRVGVSVAAALGGAAVIEVDRERHLADGGQSIAQ